MPHSSAPNKTPIVIRQEKKKWKEGGKQGRENRDCGHSKSLFRHCEEHDPGQVTKLFEQVSFVCKMEVMALITIDLLSRSSKRIYPRSATVLAGIQ